jgi:hypothetical protein
MTILYLEATNLVAPYPLPYSAFESNETKPLQQHFGAATRSRTLDLLITSELLYQLSYGGRNGSGSL